MQWFSTNLAQALLVIGIILLITEVVVLGFSTFFLFFVGLAAVSTAVLIFIGVLPDNLLTALLSTGGLTLVFAAALWKKLGELQRDVDKTPVTSDLIGHRFVSPAEIAPGQQGPQRPRYEYSGISWVLCSEQHINQGEHVKVSAIEVGMMTVVKVEV